MLSSELLTVKGSCHANQNKSMLFVSVTVCLFLFLFVLVGVRSLSQVDLLRNRVVYCGWWVGIVFLSLFCLIVNCHEYICLIFLVFVPKMVCPV